LKQKFIDEYFQIVLPKILGNDSFIRKIKSSDDLAFALTSGIAINVDTVVLGMKADALLPSEFFETKVVPDENKQEALEKKEINNEKKERIFTLKDGIKINIKGL